MSDKDKNELPSKEEVKKRAGLVWMMTKGLFRVIIPRKWTKWRIIVAIAVLVVIVYIINVVISFVMDVAIWIAAAILVIAGIYMLVSGKNPVSKSKD